MKSTVLHILLIILFVGTTLTACGQSSEGLTTVETCGQLQEFYLLSAKGIQGPYVVVIPQDKNKEGNCEKILDAATGFANAQSQIATGAIGGDIFVGDQIWHILIDVDANWKVDYQESERGTFANVYNTDIPLRGYII